MNKSLKLGLLIGLISGVPSAIFSFLAAYSSIANLLVAEFLVWVCTVVGIFTKLRTLSLKSRAVVALIAFLLMFFLGDFGNAFGIALRSK